jgi:hypothetical protein
MDAERLIPQMLSDIHAEPEREQPDTTFARSQAA